MRLTVTRDFELIDTCWDVKKLEKLILIADYFELIDTCWDVKVYPPPMRLCACLELIDTCWDVKKNLHTALTTS